MARLKEFYEASEVFAGADRPTRDDVSLTLDGRRLDTPESVVEFVAAMRTSRDPTISIVSPTRCESLEHSCVSADSTIRPPTTVASRTSPIPSLMPRSRRIRQSLDLGLLRNLRASSELVEYPAVEPFDEGVGSRGGVLKCAS